MKKYAKITVVTLIMSLILSCNFAMAKETKDNIGMGAEIGLLESIGGFDFKNAPSLIEDELTLKIGDSFDLDIDNKIEDSKYYYTVLGKDVATVSHYKGIVKAKSEGITTVYCQVKLSDGTLGVLKCKVTVAK